MQQKSTALLVNNPVLILLFCFMVLLSGCQSSQLNGKSANMQSQESIEVQSETKSVAPQTSPLRREAVDAVAQEAEMDGGASAIQKPGSSPVTSGVAGATFRPQIIKTASLSLRVEDISESMKQLESVTRQYQGIITNQALTVTEPGSGYRQGSLEVRVPEQFLDGFLAGLHGVGKVLSQEMTGTDVGAEIVDNESRIKNLRAEEEALQGIMKRAGKIPDVLEVSRELARVRGEIEQAQGRLNYLKQQVAYSTVRIVLSEEQITAPGAGQEGLGLLIENTFKQAASALESLMRGAVKAGIWLVVYFLPLFALIGLIGWVVIRRLVLWGLHLLPRRRAMTPTSEISETHHSEKTDE